MRQELPEGWVTRPLENVFDINPPKPPPDALSASAPVSFVPMPAVDAANGTIGGATDRAFGEVRKSYTAFADDDVLLAKITPCFENGKAAIARDLTNGLGFGSSEFFVLRSRGSVLPEYVFHFVRQQSVRDEGAASMTGAVGQARVPAEFVRSIELPVPPLAEQRRIITHVEALLEQVNRAKGRLERVPVILKKFRQALLMAACSGELTREWRDARTDVRDARTLLADIAKRRSDRGLSTAKRPIPHEDIDIPDTELPESWAWCRVGQIADVRLGGTPPRKEPRYWKGSVPWVSSGEVANCRISDTTEKITKAGLENSNAKLYPVGSVLIAMIGEGKTRGQSAILDIEAATNQNAAGLVFDVGLVDSEYIWYWALQEYAKNREEGRGGNQAALNGAKVRALPVPLPPVEEQVEIVRVLKNTLGIADAIERRVQTAKARAGKLPQAILSKAFSGELVPTEAELARIEGREYETASDLLARISTGTSTDSVAHRLKRKAPTKATRR